MNLCHMLIGFSIFLSIQSFLFPICKLGHPDKCVGAIYIATGAANPHLRPFAINKTRDLKSCFKNCSLEQFCFMAIFTESQHQCSFYNESRVVRSNSVRSIFFEWHCCKLNVSYQVDGQQSCPGFWVWEDDAVSENKVRGINDSVLVLPKASRIECMYACLRSPVCGAVNIRPSPFQPDGGYRPCELIMQFPVQNITSIPKHGWTTYVWRCAANFTIGPLEPEDSECHLSPGGLGTGRWLTSKTAIPVPVKTSTLLHFFTEQLHECLKNCELYGSQCARAWYSGLAYICVLEAAPHTHCALPLHETVDIDSEDLYSNFVWQLCPYRHPDNLTVESAGVATETLHAGQCLTIANKDQMWVYDMSCGEVPSRQNQLQSCSRINKYDLLYNAYLHCQTNQSLRLVERLRDPARVAHLEHYRSLSWLMLTTGYENIWLVNTTNASLVPAPQERCSIFDASYTDLEGVNDSLVVRRSVWFARRPRFPLTRFQPGLKVHYVLIGNTEVPRCSCFSREACGDTLRNNQLRVALRGYPDMLQNFLIGGDGVVYEARGWDLKPHNTWIQSDVLSVGFIGRFTRQDELNLGMVQSLKRVILLGIKRGRISANYTLLVHNDIATNFEPQFGMERVVYLHPHYRGHVRPATCSKLHTDTLILNVQVVVVVLVLLAVLCHWLVHPLRHQPHCRTLVLGELEKIYSADVLYCCEAKNSGLLMLPIQALLQNHATISIFTTTLFWAEPRNSRWLLSEDTHQRGEAPCQCRVAVEALVSLHHFRGKLLRLDGLMNSLHNAACGRHTALLYYRSSDSSITDTPVFLALLLHVSSVADISNFVVAQRSSCVCARLSLHQLKPHSQQLLLAEQQSIMVRQHSYFRDRLSLQAQFCAAIEQHWCWTFF